MSLRTLPRPTSVAVCSVLAVATALANPLGDNALKHTNSNAHLKFLAQTGGETRTLAVEGGYVFIGAGPRLVIIDAQDPLSLRKVGETQPFPGIVRDVAVANGIAYAAVGEGGLWVIDASDQNEPKTIAGLALHGEAVRIALAEGLAYVLLATEGLRVIDVRSPARPQELGTLALSQTSYALDVAVAGAHAFVVDLEQVGNSTYGRLRVVDVQNPANMEIVDTGEDGRLATGVRDAAIAVAEGRAYVAMANTLFAIDIQNPRSPRVVKRYNVNTIPPRAGPAVGVAIGNRYAYVASSGTHPWFGGLAVIDLEAGDNSGLYMHVADHVSGVFTEDGYVFAAVRERGFRIIRVDFDNLQNSEIINSFHTPGPPKSVAVSGGQAYVAAGWGGLSVVDVNSPTRPVLTGIIDPGVIDNNEAIHVALPASSPSGQLYASIKDSIYAETSSLHVVDVRDPKVPHIVGRAHGSNVYDGLYRLASDRGYVFVASRAGIAGGGLRVFDARDPSAPHEVWSLALPNGGAGNITLAGDTLYVGNATLVRLFDISDPLQPREVGASETPDYVNDIAVMGRYAYIASPSGVRVLDVSNPALPRDVGFLSLREGALAISIDRQGRAYVAFGPDSVLSSDSTATGVYAIDVSDSTDMRVMDQLRVPGRARDISVIDDLVFLAADDGGLVTLRLAEGPRPTPTPTNSLEKNATFLPFVVAAEALGVGDHGG